MFPTYGKIETLYERDVNTFKVVEGRVRRSEFAAIPHWDVTEKIDGTNVRVNWSPHGHSGIDLGGNPSVNGLVKFGGRKDGSQMPMLLLDYLVERFTAEKFAACFPDNDASVTLYGEGYGAKIQKGGGNYRPDARFRLFDVLIHGETKIWLKHEDVMDVAKKLGVLPVPFLGVMPTDMIVERVRTGMMSTVALQESGKGHPEEGVVARAPHGMLDRMGRRIMWKLKTKDF
jgi:hypothetical protein